MLLRGLFWGETGGVKGEEGRRWSIKRLWLLTADRGTLFCGSCNTRFLQVSAGHEPNQNFLSICVDLESRSSDGNF